MALTPQVRNVQTAVRTVTERETTLSVTQTAVRAIYNIPTDFLNISNSNVRVVMQPERPVRVMQGMVRAVVTGRIFDPTVRVWTFTLDGHDFYVIRLGNNETLVYDLLTEQWSLWSSANQIYWSVLTGTNWVGGNKFAAEFGSNIVVGSDSNGSLFFLDPDKPNDDAVVEGRNPIDFRRRVTGQLKTRGYDLTRVFELQLLGSIGELDVGANLDIDLLYSDNRGDSYVSAGVITTEQGNYEIRASWRGLGSFSSPGRLFRIEDFGALKRIDSLTVNTNLQA